MTNEVGRKFGRLTIISIDREKKPAQAICLCDCGNVVSKSKADVVSGHTLSCGCLQKERAAESAIVDFTGVQSSAGVKILSRAYQTKRGPWMWKCLCPLCNGAFNALPAKVISNHTTSCGCKISSSKERIIESFLISNGIEYERQKRFEDCKDRYTLPFDFAIFDDEHKSIIALIEYDGRQHTMAIPFWGGEDGYRKTERHDDVKTRFCEASGIRLLRIPYYLSDEEIKEEITNIIYP